MKTGMRILLVCRKSLFVVVAALFLGVTYTSKATLAAEWTFNNQTLTATTIQSTYVSAATLATVGTTAFVAGSTAGAGDYGSQITGSGTYQFALSTHGLYDYTITYQATKGGGSPATTWSWSLNGTTWSTANVSLTGGGITGNGGNLATSWNSYTATFSDASLNGYNGTVYFRMGVTNSSGQTATFDNFDVNFVSGSPVPEPMTYSLAAFGLVFVGGGVGRYYFGRRKANIA
jgi:hypothetical protein